MHHWWLSIPFAVLNWSDFPSVCLCSAVWLQRRFPPGRQHTRSSSGGPAAAADVRWSQAMYLWRCFILFSVLNRSPTSAVYVCPAVWLQRRLPPGRQPMRSSSGGPAAAADARWRPHCRRRRRSSCRRCTTGQRVSGRSGCRQRLKGQRKQILRRQQSCWQACRWVQWHWVSSDS
jgi:hypothetical protein